MNDFSSSKKIEQGLIYGNSVKTLRIDGLNAKQLDRELVRRGSKYRPQPHASKSVRYPADASYENFEFEAFKVDDLGMALPKWSKDIRNPYGNNTPKGAPFLDNWADDTHINLQLAN